MVSSHRETKMQSMIIQKGGTHRETQMQSMIIQKGGTQDESYYGAQHSSHCLDCELTDGQSLTDN